MNNGNARSNDTTGQGQTMNNNGRRNNSPMELARQNNQRGFNQNPYINQNSGQNIGQNPYYNNNGMNNMQNQMPQQQKNTSLFGAFNTSNFIKGALLGAVGAYLLTNEKAQKTIFKSAVNVSDMFQAGMEEMKERFEDAKAEMDAQK